MKNTKNTQTKKAQVQMMETMIVLFIFFLLVVMGFVFYGKVLKGSIEEDRQETAQLDAIKIAQRAASLPELACTERNILSDNCVDILKLDVAQQLMQDNEVYYWDVLGFSEIKIKTIYPEKKEWMIYNRSRNEFSYKPLTPVPVLISNPVNDENYFGVMEIYSYIK